MRPILPRRLAGIVFSLSLAAGCTPVESGGGNGGNTATGGSSGSGGSRGSGGSPSGSGGGSGGSNSGSGGTSSGSSGGSPGSSGGTTGAGGAGSGGASGGDAGGSSDGTPSTPSSGSKSKMIKLDTTPAGADVAGDVLGYPVALVLDANSIDFASAKSKGEDVRFFGADDKPLPYEIELWDATAKKAAIWVKVDVKGNSTQMIKMTWGDANAAAGSNSKAVFSKEEGFLGAWHLSEPGSTTADGYKDSSSNEAHATGVGMTAGGTMPGRVGNAIVLDIAKMQWAEVSAEKTVLKPEKMTYSIWVNPKSHTVEYQAMFTKGEGDFRLHYFGKAEYYGNRHLTEACLESSVSNDVCPVSRQGVDVKPGTGWYLMMAIHNHPDAMYFVNGKQEAKLTANNMWKTAAAAKVMIGNNSSNTKRAFDGALDEARLMVVAKDANWAKLEYESQKEGQKFSSFLP